MKQKEALKIMKKGHHVFLTGCAGSGKTHVLNEFISFLKKKEIGVGVTASTGIAATHLNGTTIHSFTGMGILEDLTKSDLSNILKKRYLTKKIKNAKVLIIDEISMLSGTQLDMADVILRSFLHRNEPFGGMQVIMCGDFFQLPPIKKNNNLYGDGEDFAYKSKAWGKLNPMICYLTEQYRHKEEGLVGILNAIREGRVEEKEMELLRGRYRAKIKSETEITKLYTHNANVDYINRKHLEQIPEKEVNYYMKGRGRSKIVENLSRNLLAPERLRLKKGAMVMFVKNNFEKGFVNGTLGKIVNFRNGYPVVKTIKGKYIEAELEKWTVDDGYEIIGEVEQVPLRLSWAITIHKSQGTTLDVAEIDLSKSFEPGMGYVALSRIRSLQGLRLMGLNKTALEVNEEIMEMDKYFKEESDKL